MIWDHFCPCDRGARLGVPTRQSSAFCDCRICATKSAPVQYIRLQWWRLL